MINFKPLVSILIASYNASDYIEATLDSCINQTYSNLEIIISDDHSTDDTACKILAWQTRLKKVRPDIRCVVLISKENKGITVNFNNALQYAKGDWIKCLGSDDILLPSAINEFVNNLFNVRDNKKVGVVFTSFVTFGIAVITPNVYPLAWTKMVISKENSKLKRNLAMLHFNNVAPGAFINKKFINGFDTTYKMLEDLPLWLRFIEDGVDTLLFDIVTVKYRIHGEQITSNSNHKLNNLLLNDLIRVNDFRYTNKYYLAYIHHKFNLYCSSKRNNFFTYLKVINPINVIIRIFEIMKK